MSYSAIDRMYAYLFFLISLLFLLSLCFSDDLSTHLGLLLIATSFVAFARFLYLMIPYVKSKAEAKVLPDQILSSFHEEKQKHKMNTLKRVFRPDFLLWGGGLLAALLWILISNLFPMQIEKIDTLYFEFSQFFSQHYNHKMVLEKSFFTSIFPMVAFLLMLFLLSFLHISLCISRFFIKANLIIFLPAFIIGAAALSVMVGRVALFQWPDTHFFIGGGVDTSRILFLLHPAMAADSASLFMARFLNTGFIGAYGFYALFIPALSSFSHVITVRRRRQTLAWVGILVITIMLCIDMFWLLSDYGVSVLMMGWFVVLACWGQLGYKSPHLQR